MLTEAGLRNAIVNAGLTFSPEAGEDYPMRTKPLGIFVQAVKNYLATEGIIIAPSTGDGFGKGLLRYYSARADMAERAGRFDEVRKYRRLAQQLPLEEL